ncbi:hypothetical protein C8Q69DRAFT_499911 [Paecilomyces variotii]|uniref:Uncharacterized protein n=1 Tax=Byssochlamys spectabilis TaxID=264951 RepID=A0A443HQW3_BYSSP|nr:hypothetical protein C8Q69DRAFT_499911 [Paecilomyces variotii]RWQ94228.1 hypothetical protein C8Q69DRAFT_499911 [Paecilomyces variotii]
MTPSIALRWVEYDPHHNIWCRVEDLVDATELEPVQLVQETRPWPLGVRIVPWDANDGKDYWRFGLDTAITWKQRLNEPVPETWTTVAAHLASLPTTKSPTGEETYTLYEDILNYLSRLILRKGRQFMAII